MNGIRNGVFSFRHTTKKSPSQTAGEIQALLIRLGASNIATTVEDFEIVGITFTYDQDGTQVAFRLPIRWEPIQDRMRQDFEKKRRRRALGDAERTRLLTKMDEQARRTAWRIALEWLRVQVAFVETGGRKVIEVFMADMLAPGRDETLGDILIERGFPALLPAPPVAEEARP